MTNICKYFILFLIFFLVLKPEIHSVEARLIVKKSGRQMIMASPLSSGKVKADRFGPSPGTGNRKVKKCKNALDEVANSGPSPGEGHKRVPPHQLVKTVKP